MSVMLFVVGHFRTTKGRDLIDHRDDQTPCVHSALVGASDAREHAVTHHGMSWPRAMKMQSLFCPLLVFEFGTLTVIFSAQSMATPSKRKAGDDEVWRQSIHSICLYDEAEYMPKKRMDSPGHTLMSKISRAFHVSQ